MVDKYTSKIIANDDKFIIFYSEWCRYSMEAIKLLKTYKLPFKGYKIENIKGGIQVILASFNKNSTILDFPCTHNTRPVIFYKGKYIGGYTQLLDILKKEFNIKQQ